LGWPPALSIGTGVSLGAVFVRRQRKLADPLIDLRLFRTPAFSASIATYMLATFAVFGPYVFIAQYLQLVLGLSPMKAGLWSMPFAVGFVVGSMLSPVLARRVRPAFLMGAGLVVAAAGFVALAQVDGASGLAVIGFTQGLQVTAITSALVVLGIAVLVMVSRHLRPAS
jgi:MFS transporter, DHA2 family, multidrug resistance protein